MGLLEGKRILLTGGSRGIGLAAAEECLKEGASLAVSYRRDSAALEKLAEDYPDRIHLFQMDVTDRAQVKAAAAEMIGSTHGVDVLINNAGVSEPSLFAMLGEDSWDRVLDTNLNGYFLMMKQVIFPMLKQRSGSIVNVSSVNGLVGNPGQSSYCASKAAVLGLTRAASKEYAAKNIRINAVAPGYIDTDMTSGIKDEVKNQLLAQVPMKRFGRAGEVAKLIVFLASDSASYITGQAFVIDGGMTA